MVFTSVAANGGGCFGCWNSVFRSGVYKLSGVDAVSVLVVEGAIGSRNWLHIMGVEGRMSGEVDGRFGWRGCGMFQLYIGIVFLWMS